MTSTDIAVLDMDALNRDLPLLISETNLETQIDNIRQWLDPFLPVRAMGISIKESSTGYPALAVNSGADALGTSPAAITESTAARHDRASNQPVLFMLKNGHLTITAPSTAIEPQATNGLSLALTHQDTVFGTFWLVTDSGALTPVVDDENRLLWFNALVSNLLYNTWCHHQNEEKIRFLNLYETVSSSLCYAGDLQELLSSIIAIIVSEMPSEEGSILLYNEETNQLEFFSAMGATGESFIQCAFPADKGVAGKALQEGAPIIVRDTQTCPFFFKDFDDDSGFVTRSILAAPIIVGEEKVGVIEAINKVGSDYFEETDKRMLIAIADEVGLAVKNARMFDYVVNSYCKLRQGLSSCKGCVRPLKTWTPCARQLDLL